LPTRAAKKGIRHGRISALHTSEARRAQADHGWRADAGWRAPPRRAQADHGCADGAGRGGAVRG
jgi:hypothetical protein